ncbi:allantoinase AllB [Selenomonas sp. TAMA-11512]|uniref:allantoinase AllB n=1 Tax=Selenomonas sp. TAMA-11512 TaxID=3095337 RepID=UPI00308B3E20|nr:allantoinase AllB [Selenomonas sp. TAMA-11512]
MFDLVVFGGDLVLEDKVIKGSVGIKDGRIAAILDPDVPFEAAQKVDATGKLVFPGAIDSHAHLNDPGYNWREDYAHGTAAAILGGYTTIVDMPLQNEPALTTGKIMDTKLAHVQPNAFCDYAFWGGLVDDNFDHLRELADKGCVAFKSFLGPVSPDYQTLTIGRAREALKILADADVRAGFHAEDYSIIKAAEAFEKENGNETWRGFLDSRPLIAELIATQNIIECAKETGARIHICHVSHPEVAEVIRQAQIDGYDVTGETCGHYLTFTEDDVIKNGSLFKCAPPLRTQADLEQLWSYVEDGTLSCIGSDHSPCAWEEKDEAKHGVFGAWGGISSIQNTVQAAFSEGVVKRGVSPVAFGQAIATGAAKVFDIYGQKGAIQVGFDADLIIIDPDKEWEITAESLLYVNQISAFVGLKGQGLPVVSILRGKIMAQDGKIVGQGGDGKFVARGER